MPANKQFLAFACPGSFATRTGGTIYDATAIAELRRLGWRVEAVELPDRFPHVDPASLAAALQILQSLPEEQPLIIDGLAFGAFGEHAAEVGTARPLVALVHHPLALETGMAPARAAALAASERAALRHADAVVVTSPTTERTLIQAFAVMPERITVALPGQAPKPLAKDRLPGAPLELLAVGTISPRKDFGSLIAALAPLQDRDWRLTIAGSLTRDATCSAELRGRIEAAGLTGRVTLTGEITAPELDARYAMSQLFVAASVYEGYGMAMMEAVACGLPVVAVRGGAVAEVLPEAAGCLVEPGDIAGFTQTLALLIDDPSRLQSLAAGARAARDHLPTWADTAQGIAAAIQAALAHYRARTA